LDAETLELLEDLLVEFGGTVLLVSHDRAFLNEVSTSLLVFEGDGAVSDYIGGYDDWQRERAKQAELVEASRSPARERSKGSGQAEAGQVKKARKLTNKERAELEGMPLKIESLETEQAQLTATLADPVFFKKGGADVSRATARLKDIERELAATYARWGELEG
jgi:ABC transport system ATP-binding/permease protein